MEIIIRDNGHSAHGAVLFQRIKERIDVLTEGAGGMAIALSVEKTIDEPESYRIDGKGPEWKITGSDERGLFFGIGKFLHSAVWSDIGFSPKATDGLVSPECPFRPIYFSVHFHNWFQQAPKEELERYFEDLLLYGYNGIECIAPVVQMRDMEDDFFHSAIEKARALFQMAKKLGLKVIFCICPNQGLVTAPHEWDADLSYDPTGRYRGHLGRNLCPNKPGAPEYLRGIWIKCLEQFLDIGLDYVSGWPYDEGGCGCAKCAPWGANGFDKLSRVLAADAKRLYPDSKFIYSTWTFDVPNDQKEYSTLYQRIEAGEMDYIDYLLTDAHDAYPRYVLEHPVLKPIVNFPEISMWKLFPWGGLGATPMPKRYEAIWNSAKKVLSGGIPYSEGLYEDVSKVQFIGYYWKKDAGYAEILREYAAYEFGEDVADDAVRLMELIEENHVRVGHVEEPVTALAEEAESLAKSMNSRMNRQRKGSWRWRILYIRAILDGKRYRRYEALGMHGEEDLHTLRHETEEKQLLKDDAEAQALYQELRDLYHCVDHDNGNNFSTLPIVQGKMLR